MKPRNDGGDRRGIIRPNWLPRPHSRKRVYPPLESRGEDGQYSLTGEGAGGIIRTTREKAWHSVSYVGVTNESENSPRFNPSLMKRSDAKPCVALKLARRCTVHKKKVSDFPVPTGKSLTKLALAGNI
jgi:hypothetical protein